MATPGYLPPPSDPSGETPEALRRHTRQIAQAVQVVMQGKLNAIAEVTLATGTAATAFVDPRLTVNSVVVWDPVTANAAADLAAGTLFVAEANRSNGSWTITHASATAADRTYRVLIIG